MEVQKFPASPNWYLCDVISSGPNGIVIYGSRNALVVAKFEDKLFDSCSFPAFESVEHAHKERVTTVRFCPNKLAKYYYHFASAGDDSIVKLWDMNTMTPIMANFAHGEGKKVISMDWTWGSSSTVLSVDDAACIVAWELDRNTTYKININKLLQAKKVSLKANTGKQLPLLIKCCPHQADLVAIGMKGGLICLLSLIDSGKILHCMRGHDKDLTSMSWCPVQENVLGGKDDIDQDRAFLLASVCKDRTIFLWRCIDGHFQKTIKLPTTFLGRNSRLPATGTYLTLDWPVKDTIICSSNYGEILRYDLSPGYNNTDKSNTSESESPNHPRSQWSLVHDIHPRGVFAVHCAQYSKLTENGKEKKVVIWSTAQDRHLIAVSLDDRKVLVNIPTIGGFVYCMTSSPFDPSRIAVGLGDFSIRIWNTGNTKEVQMSTLWQKIKGKVMAIAWHPTQEMKLAFGTHEGRVGIQDIIPRRLPTIFILRHRLAVYALSWGPPCYMEGESENLPQFCLYSCGDGEIILYNPDDPDREPKRMSLLMKKGEGESKKKSNTYTDVAWKPDYSLLAVGNNDGTVQLFTPPHLKLVYTLYAHRKLVMTLIWHPMSTSSDAGLSSMRNCLATGSNDSMIHVYDLTSLTNAVSEGVDFTNPIQPIATLAGHQKKAVRLSWSPHISGQLCSASYDSTIRVWDVIHQTCIACFTGHSGAGLACMWSPLDPDIIISGSTDFTLCAWRISMNKCEAKHATKANIKRKAPAITTSPMEKTEKPGKTSDESSGSVAVAKTTKEVEGGKTGSTWKGSLFPISWKHTGGIGVIDGVRQLLEKEEGYSLKMSDEPTDAKLLFFGDREDMHTLLKKEEDHHMAQENVEQAQLISLWRGNIADMIKDAITKENLSHWLVSMAPAASHKLWVEACQVYAGQLAKNRKYNHAAAYLLACHKVDEAIELLRSRNLYREALSIAHCRLEPDDPTVHSLTLEWGRNLFQKGNFEVAAMCFTSAGEYLEASKALANRSTYPECIALAADLALRAGTQGKDLAKVFAMQCMHLNLQNSNWDGALECIKKMNELEPLSLVIELHKQLEKGFQTYEEMESDLLCTWLTGECKVDTDLDRNSTSLLQLSPLPWNADSELSPEDAYLCISNRRGEKVRGSRKNFILELAEELALSLCATSSGGELNVCKWNHILKAMALSYSQQLLGTTSEAAEKQSLLKLCILLAPNGPKDMSQLFGDSSPSNSSNGFIRSVRAYAVFAAVTWEEEKWVVANENKWPWSALASFILSHLPDILDSQTADFYKTEVEIHKIEQELVKAKARFRVAGESGNSGDEHKLVVGVNGLDIKGSSVSAASGVDSGSDLRGAGDGLLSVNSASEEEQKIKTLEELIKEKECELCAMRERLELFENSRISAPNPFICFFKLRNVCENIIKSFDDENQSLPNDVLKLKEEVDAGISF